MAIQRFIRQRNAFWRLLPGVALLLTIALALGIIKPAQAATTTINNQASCVAFGGTWQGTDTCTIARTVTLAAGDILTIQVPTDIDSLTNNGTLNVQAALTAKYDFTNRAGATVNIANSLSATQFINEGVINVTGTMTLLSRPARNQGGGQITVKSGGTLTIRSGTGLLENSATITVECGGTMVYDATTFSGTAPKFSCISNQASCLAFGGTWQSFDTCTITRDVTVAAGDTLTLQVPTDIDNLTNNGTLNVQAALTTKLSFANRAGATVNIANTLAATQFTNEGVINVTGTMTLLSRPARNQGGGQINVKSGGTLTIRAGTGLLENSATITIECGGTMVYDATTFSGNPPKDNCLPSVTINQAAGQVDPAGYTPIKFVAVFRQAVTGFTATDVRLSGTANLANATVTISGGPSNYTINVNGVTGNGTVIATIPANLVTDAEGQGNPASTSTDNSVTFTTVNTINNQASCVAFGGTWQNMGDTCTITRDVTVAAGNTLTLQVPTDIDNLTNNGTLNVQATLTAKYAFTNRAGATVNIANSLYATQFINEGVINVTGTMNLLSRPARNQGGGQINVKSGGTLTIRATGFLENSATITVECDGTIVYDATTFSGNPPQNNCPYTIVNDGPSCIAAGGTYTAAIFDCAIPTIHVAAGAIFEIASSGSLSVVRIGSVTNNGTFKANSFSVRVTSFNNEGTIEVLRSMTSMGELQNNGVINIHGDLSVRQNTTLTNNGAITVACSGSFTNEGSYSGTPPQYEDCSGPIATPLQSPAANAAGWNKGDVTVDWHWVDQHGLNTANCTTRSTSSGEGMLTLTATCQDSVGNVGTASYTVKVDKTAPALTVTGKPNKPSNVTSPTFTFAATDNSGGSGLSHYNCLLDGQQTLDCTSPFTTAPLTDGSHLFILSAYDVAGNSTPFVYSWTIDTQRPTVTVNQAAGQADPATSNPILFTASFSRPVTNFASNDVTLGGTANLSGATVTISGGNVNYTIRVDGVAGNGTVTAAIAADRATDTIGNGNTASTSTDNSVTFEGDNTAPVITPNVVGTLGSNDWYTSDVNVTWRVVDNESAISNQSGCNDQSITSDTSGVTITCAATSIGGNSSQSVTIKRDATAPAVTVTGVSDGGSYTVGSVPSAACSTSDARSGVATQATLSLTGGNPNSSGSFTATCSGATDLAGNSAAAVSVNYVVNTPPPTPTHTPLPPTATPTDTPVPPTATSTATPTDTPVPPTATSTDTPVPPTATPTDTPVPPTATSTDTPVPPTATPTDTPVPPTATSTDTPVPPTATSIPSADACLTTALRDDFNRADGSLGNNWAGLNDPRFFQLAANGVDVQLGGLVVWKPTTFGVNQAAFVTLSLLDPISPAQGLLLKVQNGTIPNAGAIAVVYDNLTKAVRVSTLRLNNFVWTAYPNVPATFANGDKLTGCVQADGAVRIYQNTTLLTTVTLRAADQSFFNAKGGKIGLWTIAALNAGFDDFGGGALPGVSGAALEVGVPDEVADDGAALIVESLLLTASVPIVDDTTAVTTTQELIPVDANTPIAPDSSEQNNRIFLPIITNLAGAALGSPGGIALLLLVGLALVGGLIHRRRQRTKA